MFSTAANMYIEPAIGSLESVCIYKQNVLRKQCVRLGEEIIKYNSNISNDNIHVMVQVTI